MPEAELDASAPMGHVPMPGDDDWQPPTLVEKQKDPLERALDDVCSVTSACSDRALEQARESESVVWQCKALEQRLVRCQEGQSSDFKLFGVQMKELNDGLEGEANARDTLSSSKAEQCKSLETNTKMELSVLAQGRKDEEARYMRNVQQRAEQTRAVLKQEHDEREVSLGNYYREATSNVDEINSGLEIQKEMRMQRFEASKVKMQEWFQTVRDNVAETRKLRTDTEAAMMDRLEEMFNRMRGEVRAERDERATNEEELLKILEETCVRVENTSNKYLQAG